MVEHDKALEAQTVFVESSVEDRPDPKAPLWPVQGSACLPGSAATSHPSPWPGSICQDTSVLALMLAKPVGPCGFEKLTPIYCVWFAS